MKELGNLLRRKITDPLERAAVEDRPDLRGRFLDMFGTISRGFEKAAVIVEMIGQRTKTAFFKGVGDAAFFSLGLADQFGKPLLARNRVREKPDLRAVHPAVMGR